MGQNCNLDLSLLPTGDGASAGTGARSAVGSPHSVKPKTEESTGNSMPLTIFYDGRVCMCDMTEIQARVILYLAKREMEDKFKVGCSEPLSPCRKPDLHAPTLSLKRSLQQFFQKRKSRINRTCPYHE